MKYNHIMSKDSKLKILYSWHYFIAILMLIKNTKY